MTGIIVDTKVVSDDFWAMMVKMRRTFDDRRFALRFSAKLRRRFQEQIDRAFPEQRAEGDAAWHPLSPMTVEKRGGSSGPILVETGLFQDETRRYKGELRLITSGFSYWFPGYREMSGQYWGLTAGQLVNPWGLKPLAAFPRRLLGGNRVQEEASITAMTSYFADEGWAVEIGR